jgi:hypothetical protein
LATHKEDAEVAQIRVKLLRDELRMVREENATLAAQVRRARVPGVTRGNSTSSASSSKPKARELTLIKQQLEEAQEACRAHQAHARFLNTDVCQEHISWLLLSPSCRFLSLSPSSSCGSPSSSVLLHPPTFFSFSFSQLIIATFLVP